MMKIYASLDMNSELIQMWIKEEKSSGLKRSVKLKLNNLENSNEDR